MIIVWYGDPAAQVAHAQAAVDEQRKKIFQTLLMRARLKIYITVFPNIVLGENFV
jgi:hypothetical protein